MWCNGVAHVCLRLLARWPEHGDLTLASFKAAVVAVPAAW